MKTSFQSILTLWLFLAFLTVNAQHNISKTDWKGFDKLNFNIADKQAHLVTPKKALAGNPWVWRARFPEYHSEIDSTLLSEGFHIAYINTNNQFGSPKANLTWNEFYAFLTKKYNLQKKVALHCHSRGGLFAYNWAKKNPEKISCIYADAIVCDFNSWPAGFKSSLGSKKDWTILKKEYGFKNNIEAKTFDNNPINNLKKLAESGTPILHTIGLNDKVVPPSENTLVLINNYIKLGGNATVIPCKSGIQKSKGHHYDIDNPKLIVDFIKYNSILQTNLKSDKFHELKNGLKNCQLVFEREKKARVAFLGGSITHENQWQMNVRTYLINRFPNTQFEFIDAGIPSMGTTPAAFRLQRDVLSKGKIDLLFEEAAVNDATNHRTKEEQIKAMEGIVRNLKLSNPAIEIVMMHFVDPDKMETYRNGAIPHVIQNHNLVANHYNIPTINLAKEVTERIDNKEFTWKDDFKNLHPSLFGQKIYTNSIVTFLENSFSKEIAKDDKISIPELPLKLDEYSYDNGKLIESNTTIKKKGFTTNLSWEPTDGKRVRPNYHEKPMLIGNSPGDYLKLKFTGNAIGIAVASGPDAGIIEYRIDKQNWISLSLFTKWSGNIHLPWYYTLANELSDKQHSLEIKISKKKPISSIGTSCRIRYFYVNN